MSKAVSVLKKELLEMIPPVVFFFIAFHILALIRSLMLKEYGVSMSAIAGATISALVVGKVVLIADVLPFIDRYPHPKRPLIYNVAWKTVIYTVAALAVHFLEHLIPIWWKTKSLDAAFTTLKDEIVWPHFWAIQICLLVLFFMYCSIRELSRALGEEKVRRLFFGPLEN